MDGFGTVIVFEFFSGTRSLTRPFEEAGHTVYSFENDPQFEATEIVDILKLAPEYLLETYGQPDFIWASPPCTSYSVGSFRHHWHAATGCTACGGQIHRAAYERWECNGCDRPRPGDLTYTPKSDTGRIGQQLLRHTRYLVAALQPRWWIIENPRALMRKMPELAGVDRRTITHCQYGDPRRMKPTDLFGIFPEGFEARACINGDPCHEAAPRGARTGTQGLKSREAAMLPPLLGIELLEAMKG